MGNSPLLMKNSKVTETRMIFARNLRREREAQGISQESLAELASLHRTYISSVERGERNISVDNIDRLSRALGMAPSVLLEKLEK